MRILHTKKKPAARDTKPRHGPVAKNENAPLPGVFVFSSLLSLESRITFDGAAVATAGAVTSEQVAQDQAKPVASVVDGATGHALPAAPTGEHQFTSNDQALFDALAAYDVTAARQEVVFVSSSVADYQKLLDGISPNVEVHILDSSRDGVQQMAEILAGRTNINAIHLIGDGTDGEMHLGSSFLTQDSISTQYAGLFQQIGQSLSANADLMIYGCDFGHGDAGQLAIQTLAALTGADVAASTDRTGSAAQYGDWNLEVSTGPIHTAVVISASAQASWDHALATFTVTNTNNSGAGSLRTAIANANSSPGADTIVFNIPGAGLHTINVNSTALPTITGQVTIDGTTEPGYSGKPLIQVDSNYNANTNSGLVLGAGSSGSTIKGLMITRFVNHGILIDGSTNDVITDNYIGTDGVANLGNRYAGIDLRNGAANDIIGGTAAGAGNVIAFNGANGWAGVTLESTAGSGTQILGNSIYSNTSLGIDLNHDGVTLNDFMDLDSGPNDLMNFPILTSAQVLSPTQISISGTYNGIANTTFRFEFFSNTVGDPTGYGQGKTYLGFVNVTTDASGNATFSTVLNASAAVGQVISATATDQSNHDTSEFGPKVVTLDLPVTTVPGAQTVAVNTPLALGGVSAADADGDLSTVQLAVTHGTVTVTHGTVTVTLQGGATISAGANGTGTLTVSGSQAAINATLATLSYRGTLNYYGADTLTVTSQATTGATDTKTVALTVTPVSALAVLTVPPSLLPIPSSGPLPVSPASGPLPSGPPIVLPIGNMSTPVLPPPVVMGSVVSQYGEGVDTSGAVDEPVRRMAVSSDKMIRQEQPEVAPQAPPPQWLEPLSIPVKKMLVVGRNFAESLNRLADDLDRVMEERQQKAHLLWRVASFSGLALTAGFSVWVLRGGSLLMSFLVSMPVWRHFDPVPVLGISRRDRKKIDQQARAAQEQENNRFRGLERVVQSESNPMKQHDQKTGLKKRKKS